MGFWEEKLGGTNFVNVAVSGANMSNIVSGSGVLHNVIVNASPTSAFQIVDGLNEDGIDIATIAATVLAGTSINYGIRYNTGLAVSAQSADTNLTFCYLPDQD